MTISKHEEVYEDAQATSTSRQNWWAEMNAFGQAKAAKTGKIEVKESAMRIVRQERRRRRIERKE